MINCIFCGFDNEDGTLLCGQCTLPLSIPPEDPLPNPIPPLPDPVPTPPPSPPRPSPGG